MIVELRLLATKRPRQLHAAGATLAHICNERTNIRHARVLVPTSLLNPVPPHQRICDVRRTHTRSAALATNGRRRAWWTDGPLVHVSISARYSLPPRSVAHLCDRSVDAPGSAPTTAVEHPPPPCSLPRNPAVARSTPRLRPFDSNAARIDSSWIIHLRRRRDHLHPTSSVGAFRTR